MSCAETGYTISYANLQTKLNHEKECIVSLKDVESKDTLVVNGITLRNRSVNFFDVEKSITSHVTIKDAPYELDDRYIVAQMIRFGQIVPGSVKRGYIKGTEIENGARYIDILNCEPVLPLRTSLGRFEVRLFADNNRTPCFHCKLIGHSSYQCKDRPKIMMSEGSVLLLTRNIKCHILDETVKVLSKTKKIKVIVSMVRK
ncbi:Hypothetical predicted protein [Mytilus galloprovincialis]|uniref:Uncharacterized protein n=1 Tax=Mytilus galloprovincialis TaxID=29158 RepID=A0A8B6BTY5_MYTGA|nr:Hypothetical predicted protein [Mytilus galloprovincialis]